MKALLLALVILPAFLTPAQPVAVDASAQCRKLGRGVNILGYDPIWRSRNQGRFKVQYFSQLKEAGFNSVRINLHAFRHMDTTNEWVLSSSWWETLDWAVSHAQAAGLMVILDLHEFNSIGHDPEAKKPQFLAFWRQVSDRYAGADTDVVFEILNEPCQKLTSEMWNRWLSEALAIIRAKNPTRTVIVGPASWNSIDKLGDLKLPADDRNLIVTVHYYEPFDYTHQGASWTDRKDKLGVDWPGTDADRQAIAADFNRASTWAKEHDRPLFLGEFGAYDKATMESRSRYLDAVVRTAEQQGWAWAYWQFDSDFILYDVRKDEWVQPILTALIPDAR